MKSVRTARGPRQRPVANLGKLPGLDRDERVGWEEIGRILSGRPREPWDFRPTRGSSCLGHGEHTRRQRGASAAFRGCVPGAFIMEAAEFGRVLQGADAGGPGGDPLVDLGCVLILARFCAPSSELQIAESWYGKTALDDLLGVAAEKVNEDRLYRALDALLPHKDELFRHFQKVTASCSADFDLLFYDITSTYFEGKRGNPQAKRGYWRDGRPDCVQVCIALVATRKVCRWPMRCLTATAPT